MACASCSRPLPDGARFCPFCGREVDAIVGDERRVVSVLFADLVGYTALSEHLDPERVKRLVDGAFQRMIAEVERFGGKLDKVLGDGILALFGAPTAHEDDPERAVRAAIEMHRALADYVATQPEIDQQVRLRVGVNTGEVVVGAVSGTEGYTAMGDVVNVAARLQAMAPPGGTYVGASTEAQLSTGIERVLVAELEVRGREQTEHVWQILGRVNRSLVSGSRHDLSFVGRVRQRELFQSVMSLVADGNGAVVTVSGEAGSGKTRLVNESLARFPSREVVVFSGVCAPYGENNVWAPIANALFKLMSVDRGVDPSQLRITVREKGLELYGFDETDPRLQRFVEGAMHLFNHPSELDRVAPSQAREILMQVVIEGLHRRSQLAPVVVWIDDVQWADPLLIELLSRITRSLMDRPVLLVTAQRDDAEIEWPPQSDHPIMIHMPLEPLSRAEAEVMLAEVFVDGVSDELGDRLYERSGGNPLFLTQLARVAHDQPGTDELPGSLRALIASRLDALTTTQRQMIDNASVLGASGPSSSLGRFAVEMQQVFDPSDLDALVDDGFFDLVDGWWRFRSDIVREVAYQTLTKSSRAQRHAGTALVMQEYGLAPIDQVAHHAACAAELVADIGRVEAVPLDIGPRAVALLQHAAERSLDVGAFSQTIRHVSRALDLGAADVDQVRALRLLRATAAVERRETIAARDDAEASLAAAIDAGDRTDEAVARRLLGVIAQQEGDLTAARHELQISVEILRELGDDRELAASLSDRGFVEVFGGSLHRADEILAEAEALADSLDDRRGLAWIRQHQAWVAFLSGDTELAEERLTASSGLFDDLGDRSGTGWANGLLAYVRFFERRFDDAEALATIVRKEALELGERWAPAMMDALVASIRLWSGRFNESEELSRRALHGFRELNDRFGILQALAPQMRALVALGRRQEAERGLEETVSLADAFGDFAFPTMAAAGTAAHLGLGERAVALGEVAVERMTAMHADGSEARIGLALGHCQVGAPEEALTVLLDVVVERPYSNAVAALAHAMLGDVDAALDHAHRVVDDATSTYLDLVLARLAAASASLAAGRTVEAEDELAAAEATADRAGDEVARSLVACAIARLLHRSDVDTGGTLGPGWLRVVGGLVGADAVGAPVA
jgi:class 3 adenylate cyclase/tetratricopeptide (TPR) repeat protein